MLRWTLLGINFCIHPSFWLMNLLMAYILYQPLMGNRDRNQLLTADLLILMVIWVLCSLVAVMVHELGHVIMGRIFGQAGNITISGLGGQAVGEYGELSPWKRIIVIFAGPGAGFLFVAGLVAVDGVYWNWCMMWLADWLKAPFFENLKCHWFLIDQVNPLMRIDRGDFPTYNMVLMLLFIINLFTNIMNLLPIIPMDGGMIFKEVCVLISPKYGLKVAFGFSFLLAAGLAVYLLLYVLVQYRFMKEPFPLYYPFAFPEFSLIIFASLAYQSFQAYQQLAARDRYAEYSEYQQHD